jgi:hypothetical protein
MRYLIIFLCLTIAFFAYSCQGQKSDLKEDTANQENLSEAAEAKPQESAPIGKESPQYVPGVILVKFKDDTSSQSIEKIQKSLDLSTIKIVSKLNLYHMRILNDASVEEVMKRLLQFSEVEYSEPNYIIEFQ